MVYCQKCGTKLTCKSCEPKPKKDQSVKGKKGKWTMDKDESIAEFLSRAMSKEDK